MPRASEKRPKHAKAKPSSSRDKVRAYRARMRAQGMRPVQIWVPDVGSPAFKAEARRQSRLISQSADEKEVMDFIEAAMDWPEK
jgi:hypothetical protein